MSPQRIAMNDLWGGQWETSRSWLLPLSRLSSSGPRICSNYAARCDPAGPLMSDTWVEVCPIISLAMGYRVVCRVSDGGELFGSVAFGACSAWQMGRAMASF